MGLYKQTPPMSGRMAALWSLAGIRESAVVEFGCMGHMNYGRMFLHRMGAQGGKAYSSHIGETDIALGDWGRLRRAAGQIIYRDKPRVLFLLPSSVPEIIGIDLKAIAVELSNEHPAVRIIPVSCGGFSADGSLGVQEVLLQLVRLLPEECAKTRVPSFNIIGSCADMFNFSPDTAEICRIMNGAFSMTPICILTSDSCISDIERMASAHINLVIRREGEAAARLLKERFGTPYLTMRPYGIEGTMSRVNEIELKLHTKADVHYLADESAACRSSTSTALTALGRYTRMHPRQSRLILAGHADTVEGIAEMCSEFSLFAHIDLYCTHFGMSHADMPYLDDEKRVAIAKDPHGFLMGDEPLLLAAGKHESLQISNPDSRWRHGYAPPLTGFRGMVNLVTILINEMVRKN